MFVGKGRFILLLAAVAALPACEAQRVQPDPFSHTGEVIALSGGDSGAANACFTCHGLDGRGDGNGSPRLAGLDVGYLGRQLDDYAIGRRKHAQMQAIAKRLSASDRQAVAAYYAAMPFEPVAASSTPAPALYSRGDPARGLWSCAQCHGANGEGMGPANPPLGGQPAAYLAEQLDKWKKGERRGDPANMMLAISRRLTAEEIETLARYSSALPGVSPNPRSPEASLSARRADPRNDASAPLPRGAER